MPIFYECRRCAACCRWPGEVRLSEEEIARLAAWQGRTELEFIQDSTRLAHDRRGLALQERPGGECVLLVGNDCSAEPVKPQQCRDFPNRWTSDNSRTVKSRGEMALSPDLARTSGEGR